MVRLTKIYTRGGDGGETSLGDGARVAKHDPRVAAYGAVDETNAAIGVARSAVAAETLSDLDAVLARVQSELFDLGADLCTPIAPDEAPDKALRIVAGQVTRLEQEIDKINAGLGELSSFVLPAGTPAAAQLHVARTVARRAEREITALAATARINADALAYINRLSDLLFVMARAANKRGPGDVLWQPGATRG
ncbi:MAG: cob(I)yrinic acid a,c-diamide adenosyltransferase [Rhodobacteraceae bacterium]|nr:cob(I)yrinic acid a,c-diamide adenosyltransferase [Planctomycetales bacterium]MCB2109058.1 cob(I)yrinic acid a,c-diamide adenosyltransferase [Paracoccaceae bacterium]